METIEPTEHFKADMPLNEFIDMLLGLALRGEGLAISGHTNRGGCIIRYRFIVDSIDLATAYHTDPETVH